MVNPKVTTAHSYEDMLGFLSFLSVYLLELVPLPPIQWSLLISSLSSATEMISCTAVSEFVP